MLRPTFLFTALALITVQSLADRSSLFASEYAGVPAAHHDVGNAIEEQPSTLMPAWLERHAIREDGDVEASLADYVSRPDRRKHNATHKMHTMQTPWYPGSTWTMDLMTARAPWSPRIQPALLYMFKETRYTQWQTNITVTQGHPWLLMYEGSLAYYNSTLGVYQNENDVWASGDMGRTWDLMAGTSRFGTSGYVQSKYPQTFDSRRAANNCEDPASDVVFSLGGSLNEVGNRQIGTNQVWYSRDGVHWEKQDPSKSFGPSRYFASCDVDESGHIFSMGGYARDQNYPEGQLLNDVWQSSIVNELRDWKRLTDKAPWGARAEHLVLIGTSEALQKELIYVMGGYGPADRDGVATVTNDVWVSSDSGVSWVPLILNGGENPDPTDPDSVSTFSARWGHSGVITSAGAILVFGGANVINTGGGNYNYSSYRDMWVSFDGGKVFTQCVSDDGGRESNHPYFHTEQGATLTDDERLILATGYHYCHPSVCGPANTRTTYRDVWMTPFSLRKPEQIQQLCPNSDIPQSGIVGLAKWPETASVSNPFVMTVQTRRAPFSARIQPAIVSISQPISYVQRASGIRITTPPNWLIMYEGSLSFEYGTGKRSNENDVWASADLGSTWDLISGVSVNGANGLSFASAYEDAFTARGAAAKCDDPLSDDVYTIGGYFYDVDDGEFSHSNQIWHSSSGVTWNWRAGEAPLDQPGSIPSFDPPRFFAECAVDYNHQVYVTGGQYDQSFKMLLLNDVWVGRNQGRTWSRVTPPNTASAALRWAPRSEHVFLITRAMETTVMYVMGGFIRADAEQIQTANDIWVSSNGGVGWSRITNSARWSKRWGHSAAVTREGVIVLIGGSDSLTGQSRDMLTYRDGWFTLDGGYTWNPLQTAGDNSFIRGEQGIAFTQDQRLILVSGYAFSANQPRTDYSDLWISNISFSDIKAIVRVAQTPTDVVVPSTIGLRVWPGTVASEPVLGTLAIVAIVVGGVLFLIVVGWCCIFKRNNRSLSLPAFMSPTSGPTNSHSQAGNGDYFTSSREADKYAFNDSSSLSDHYQPPSGGYQAPTSGYQAPTSYQPPSSSYQPGGYQPPSGAVHGADSHGLLS